LGFGMVGVVGLGVGVLRVREFPGG
jgi:hypothetical protein